MFQLSGFYCKGLGPNIGFQGQGRGLLSPKRQLTSQHKSDTSCAFFGIPETLRGLLVSAQHREHS